MAVSMDIIEKSGSWYSYNGSRIAQGRENAKKYLETNPEIMEEIADKIRTALTDTPVDVYAVEMDEDDSPDLPEEKSFDFDELDDDLID